jgi:hypothetical protein
MNSFGYRYGSDSDFTVSAFIIIFQVWIVSDTDMNRRFNRYTDMNTYQILT